MAPQVRRAAVSVPSNLAEGSGRRRDAEFIRFIDIAYSSLSELETQLILAESLKFLPRTKAKALLKKIAEIGRMLNGLRTVLQNSRA